MIWNLNELFTIRILVEILNITLIRNCRKKIVLKSRLINARATIIKLLEIHKSEVSKMTDVKNIAHELLTKEILQGFKGKITGDNADYIIGENPENRYFVGKLLPVSDSQTSSWGSDVFIEAIGSDFFISQDEIGTAQLNIQPKGDFYYRAYPTLEQQRVAMLQKANELFETGFANFDEIISKYKEDPIAFSKLKEKLIPVYKKVQLHKDNFSVTFTLSELLHDNSQYGYVDASHIQNKQLEQYLNDLQTLIWNDEYCYTHELYEKTTIKDLRSEADYKNFLEKNAKQGTPIRQNWNVYIDITIKLIRDKYLVSVALVNGSQVQSNGVTHKSNKKSNDKPTIETLFNSGIEIKLCGANFFPIDLDFFADDYKYNSSQKAIGNNCSIVYDEENNSIITNHLPIFVQKRLVTNDELAVSFQSLIDHPVATLKDIHRKMVAEHRKWENIFEEKKQSLSPVAIRNMKDEIDEFARETRRFEFGIEIINDYPIIMKSFVNMNWTFLKTSKKYNTWRLFQIVFIVSLIPDIAACDEDVLLDSQKAQTTLNEVSLLYFPTGGGKTEAFLGVLVFNLFFDRYRGKESGVTSILRYPLRLLSVQQVQRLANILAQAELLRRADATIANTEEFSLGYFVGDANTPNKIEKKNVIKYRTTSQTEMDEERIIDICPFCGKQTVHLKFDEDSYRLVHYCDNLVCPSNGVLPIYMVDYEIYRYLPSVIISTVDKLAILGNNPSFRNILSGADHKCPKHGFTSTGKCMVDREFCSVSTDELEKVEMYDPAPTLFIQDELHLIRESLGTYASHYESFIDYIVKNVSPSHRPIKIIGATATISSYATQISQLYSKDPIRFPCASPDLKRNFYSYIEEEDIQRLIMGYAPYGKAIINSVVYSLKYMREVVFEFLKNPEKILEIPGIGIDSVEDALEILKDYWIFLEYNNVKRDGNNVEGALETPINVELRKEGVIPFNTRKMTGDETFQDVREVLSKVETNDDVFGGVNLIVATSMISHGVDADRFNIMFFYGMPGNTAEYIQAYSRTGRRYSSIVIDIMRPSRETDQSYLKNFVNFHEFKDILVEPVPINRWATKAIDCTLPGIFTGLLLTKYDPELQYAIGPLFFMNNIKKAIVNGSLDSSIICNELKMAYVCTIAGQVNEIGNQYRTKIESFVEDIFEKIVDKNWEKENIFSGFELMGYHIMNSLRDTDTQLIIELE